MDMACQFSYNQEMSILSHPSFNDIALPNILYALGDPSRLAIVKNLMDADKPLTCVEAVKGIKNLPVSTRSRYFQMLRQAGVIRSQKNGRECYNEIRLKELDQKFPNLIVTILNQAS